LSQCNIELLLTSTEPFQTASLSPDHLLPPLRGSKVASVPLVLSKETTRLKVGTEGVVVVAAFHSLGRTLVSYSPCHVVVVVAFGTKVTLDKKF
jgi:hypothetical protein